MPPMRPAPAPLSGDACSAGFTGVRPDSRSTRGAMLLVLPTLNWGATATVLVPFAVRSSNLGDEGGVAWVRATSLALHAPNHHNHFQPAAIAAGTESNQRN